MTRVYLTLLLLAVPVIIGDIITDRSTPEQKIVRNDGSMLMTAVLMPIGITGYCYQRVIADTGLLETTKAWAAQYDRFFKIAAVAVRSTDRPSGERMESVYRDAYRAAQRSVGSQKDKAAHCRDHGLALRDGRFNLVQDREIFAATHRIMNAGLVLTSMNQTRLPNPEDIEFGVDPDKASLVGRTIARLLVR